MEGLTPGRIVHYVLNEQNADEINRRRVPGVGHAENWPAGAQAHVGNPSSAGDHVVMVIVRVWSHDNGLVNGHVLLDGNDSLWVTSVAYDEDQASRTWHWIEKA